MTAAWIPQCSSKSTDIRVGFQPHELAGNYLSQILWSNLFVGEGVQRINHGSERLRQPEPREPCHAAH